MFNGNWITVVNVDVLCELDSALNSLYHRLHTSQHCCNDDQKSQWENWDFDPLKILLQKLIK